MSKTNTLTANAQDFARSANVSIDRAAENASEALDTTLWPHTTQVLHEVHHRLAPRLDTCGDQEMTQLLRGLQGRFVPPGPSGAPSRGRLDVLPTGRNLYAVDPRAVPSRAAHTQGVKLAEELLRKALQDQGDWPQGLVVDLWGSATMRTAGCSREVVP